MPLRLTSGCLLHRRGQNKCQTQLEKHVADGTSDTDHPAVTVLLAQLKVAEEKLVQYQTRTKQRRKQEKAQVYIGSPAVYRQ